MLFTERDTRKLPHDIMDMLREETIEAANELYEVIMAKDIERIDELFKAFISNIEVHFTTEEQLMEQAHFSLMGVHKSDHDMMREKLKKFYKRWEILKGPNELRGFFNKEFKVWYIGHVAKWDSQTAIALD